MLGALPFHFFGALDVAILVLRRGRSLILLLVLLVLGELDLLDDLLLVLLLHGVGGR